MMHHHLPHARSLFGPRRLLVLLILGLAAGARADVPRVLEPGKLPDDQRLGEPRTLDPTPQDHDYFIFPADYFTFTPPRSKEAWDLRAERLRRQVLMATGLWPMPSKTPANAVIHGKVDRGEYTVEKVYLESFPGHFVTGNLYRPKGRSGPGPGVLCPHGHWSNGRFHDAGKQTLDQWIKNGEEKYPSGWSPLQARCAKLARMGCTVFHYDMVGYADSVQLGHSPGLRDAMNTPENWGYFSPQAEARLQNMMGLQTYNSTRALDWLSELPEVDPKRIAVTGASGGGTQTFILCAVDPRPAVAFPAVMVSADMQGGCTCENACYLRVDTGNIEISALVAPRPLGMTAANDWTRLMETLGQPELKQVYRLFGAEDRVMAKHFPFGHNYNYVSRSLMYEWLNKHLGLGQQEPIVEEDFQPLSREEMTVWDDEHPKPPGGEEHERALLRWITEDSEKQIAALIPTDAASLARYRQVVGGAVDVMIGRNVPDPGDVKGSRVGAKSAGQYDLTWGLVRYPDQGEEIPVVGLEPQGFFRKPDKQVVVWIDPSGKRSLFDENGDPKPAIVRLLDAGMAVVGVDLFGQGEFTPHGTPLEKNPLDPKRANYAGYTYGYNHPLFSKRVHDVLTVIAWLRGPSPFREAKIHLVGLNRAGHWVAAARAQAGAAVARAAVDTGGFRFANLTDFADPDFLPGGAKYLDLPGMLALSAPGELWIAGEGPEPLPVAAAYQAAGSPAGLTVFDGEASTRESAALEWLLRQ